jgi:hypothetical protein
MKSPSDSKLYSTPTSQAYNHLLRISLLALAIFCLTAGARATIIDDLFTWALKQPPTNTVSVTFAMAGNEITRNNLVSYAVGTLYYQPARLARGTFLPASFSSSGVTQYFSDRRYNFPAGSLDSAPFNPANTDPLTVTIGKQYLFATTYSVNLTSPKWGFNYTFTPNYDGTTKILYGTMGNTFLTISLGNQESVAPVRIP